MTAHSAPPASNENVRRRMQRQRRRDTDIELALRKELHARGLRYRVDVAPLRGGRRRADVVFRPARVAVYLDSCFWHGCPQHGTWPKANARWWRDKIETNRRRDADTDRMLDAEGWHVVRVWEHDDVRRAADRIEGLVRTARAS